MTASQGAPSAAPTPPWTLSRRTAPAARPAPLQRSRHRVPRVGARDDPREPCASHQARHTRGGPERSRAPGRIFPRPRRRETGGMPQFGALPAGRHQSIVTPKRVSTAPIGFPIAMLPEAFPANSSPTAL